MQLSGSEAAILLSNEGAIALRQFDVAVPDPPVVSGAVRDTDENGIWIEIARDDGKHVVLVRWEYVLSIDLRGQESRRIGLRP